MVLSIEDGREGVMLLAVAPRAGFNGVSGAS